MEETTWEIARIVFLKKETGGKYSVFRKRGEGEEQEGENAS